MSLVTYVILVTPVEQKQESIVVSVHEKGDKRGVAIYFSSEAIKMLENQGLNLKKEKNFIAQLQGDRICLIPLFEATKKKLNIKAFFEITSKLDEIMTLSAEEKEELCEELLSIIVERGIKLSEVEKTAIMRMIKGVYTKDVLKIVLSACIRADEGVTLAAIEQFVKTKGGDKNGI